MVRTNDHRPAHVHVIFPGGKVDIVVNLQWRRPSARFAGTRRRVIPNTPLMLSLLTTTALRTKWKKLHGRFG